MPMKLKLLALCGLAAAIASVALADPKVLRLTPPSDLFSYNDPNPPYIARFLPGQRFDLQATVKPDAGQHITAARFLIDGKPVAATVALRDCASGLQPPGASFPNVRATLPGLYASFGGSIPRIANVLTFADFVNHIDYAVKLIGIDHVGISSDFDGGGGIDGFNCAGEAINVTIELVKRCYTEDQIAKLWGGNLLRVMEQAEKVAKDLQAKKAS